MDTRSPKKDSQSTYFGSQKVKPEEKRQKVNQVFSTVAERYDQMNDLMSWGAHRLWKRFMVMQARIDTHHWALEIAAGSCDLAPLILARKPAKLLLGDVNRDILVHGHDRLLDRGIRLPFAQFSGESIPLVDDSFDRIFLSFGLRNIVDQEACLREIKRVLRPPGYCLILEFSMDVLESLKPLYDMYRTHCIPWLGKWVAGSEGSYRYLAESIRQQRSRAQMCELMKDVGFSRVRTNSLSAGIVTLYRGWD